MKRTSLSLVMALGCIFFAFAVTANAQAPHTVTVTRGQGMLAALRSAGCNSTWLHKAMETNNVSVVELRKLKIGRPLTMPEGCSERAPEEVAQRSTLVIEQDRTGVTSSVFVPSTETSVAKTPATAMVVPSGVITPSADPVQVANTQALKETQELNVRLVQTIKDAEKLQADHVVQDQKTNEQLAIALTALQNYRQKEEEAAQSSTKKKILGAVTLAMTGIGMVLGCFLAWLYLFQKNRKNILIPREIRVFDPQGRPVIFRPAPEPISLTGYVIMACPLCGGDVRKEECGTHLWDQTVHANLRVSLEQSSVAAHAA